MRILLLLFLLLQAPISQADTVDYWTVHLGRKMLTPVKGIYRISRAALKAGDSLFVNYFNDTPCETCTAGLYLARGVLPLPLCSVTGTFTPLGFPLNSLLQWSAASGRREFLILYKEEDNREDSHPPRPLFTLLLD